MACDAAIITFTKKIWLLLSKDVKRILLQAATMKSPAWVGHWITL